jgi:hypothetical protein
MHADGLQLLRAAFLVAAAVDVGAFVGMLLPARFGAALRYLTPFDPGRVEFAYGMRYGAPLMAGWTVLLLWGLGNPFARRDLLIITIVPVLVGLMANDTAAARRGFLRPGPLWAVRALQIGLVVLFAVAYIGSR